MNPSLMNRQPISMQNSSMTKLIVVALIVIAIIAAGIYFLTRPKSENSVSDMDKAILEDISQVSAGNSAADIQADINATNLQLLDDELESLNQEIQGL